MLKSGPKAFSIDTPSAASTTMAEPQREPASRDNTHAPIEEAGESSSSATRNVPISSSGALELIRLKSQEELDFVTTSWEVQRRELRARGVTARRGDGEEMYSNEGD